LHQQHQTRQKNKVQAEKKRSQRRTLGIDTSYIVKVTTVYRVVGCVYSIRSLIRAEHGIKAIQAQPAKGRNIDAWGIVDILLLHGQRRQCRPRYQSLGISKKKKKNWRIEWRRRGATIRVCIRSFGCAPDGPGETREKARPGGGEWSEKTRAEKGVGG
jgi:hypothetical protein